MTTTENTILVRRDTSTNWASANPVPKAGEWCYETDTGVTKIGDGTTQYTSLTPIGKTTASTTELDILDGATVTTEELNKLDGLTATTTQLNYVTGVTSGIQTQLNAKVNTSDIQTSFGATPSDEKVASEKLVKTSLDAKQGTLTQGAGITVINDVVSVNGIVNPDIDGVEYTEPSTYKNFESRAFGVFDDTKVDITGTPAMVNGVVTNTKCYNGTLVNAVSAKNITLANIAGGSWEIISPKCFGSVQGAVFASVLSDGTFGELNITLSQVTWKFKTGTGNDISNTVTISASTIGGNSTDGVVCKMKYNNATGVYELLYDIGGGWVSAGTHTATTENTQLNRIIDYPGTKIFFGVSYNATVSANFDLKTVEIIKDGEPLYYLNKRTIDGENNYTVDGEPTITFDGKVSGFTTSGNVVKSAVLDFIPTSNLTFRTKFTTGSDVQTVQFLMRLYNDATGAYVTNALYIKEGYLQGYGADSVGANSGKALSANTTYYAELTWTETNGYYTVRCSTDDTNWTSANITGATTPMQGGNTTLFIGQVADNNFVRPFFGQIDLAQTQIIVDGKVVWQGTDIIPAHVAPDGQKFADIKYKERVADMFTQKHYAPYAVIDTANKKFVLPYGSPESRNANNIVVDEYKSGLSTYKKYLNRTLVQTGSCTSGTDVTFPCSTAFADTNYVCSVPYSAKTTTGFTPSATGEYIVIGKF